MYHDQLFPYDNCHVLVLVLFQGSTLIVFLSAVSPDDYGGVPLALLLFAACQRRSCLNVTIVDDDLLEGTETFRASLTRPFDLDTRIILDPVDGVVQISDNDGMNPT